MGPLMLLLSENHREQIEPFVIPAAGTAVILGFLWLVRDYPVVNWTARAITAWSPDCHARCLGLTLAPTSATTMAAVAKLDLSGVPAVYLDLAEIFSKQRALSLLLGCAGLRIVRRSGGGAPSHLR